METLEIMKNRLESEEAHYCRLHEQLREAHQLNVELLDIIEKQQKTLEEVVTELLDGEDDA